MINTSIIATQEDTFYHLKNYVTVKNYDEFINALATNTATDGQPIPDKSLIIFCSDGFNIPSNDTIWINQARTLILGADIVFGNNVKIRSIGTGQLYLEIQSEFRMLGSSLTIGNAVDDFALYMRLEYVKGSSIDSTLDIINYISDFYVNTKKARNLVVKKHPLSTGSVTIVAITSDFYSDTSDGYGDNVITTIDRDGNLTTEITYVYDGVNGVKVFDMLPTGVDGIRVFEVYDRQVYTEGGSTVYGINLNFSALFTSAPVILEELAINPASLLGYFRKVLTGNDSGYYTNHWDLETINPTVTITKTGSNTDKIIRRMTIKGIAENTITQK